MVGVGYRRACFPVTELPARFYPSLRAKKAFCLRDFGQRLSVTPRMCFSPFSGIIPPVFGHFSPIFAFLLAYFYADLSLPITGRKILRVLEPFLAATNDDGPNDPPFKSPPLDPFYGSRWRATNGLPPSSCYRGLTDGIRPNWTTNPPFV